MIITGIDLEWPSIRIITSPSKQPNLARQKYPFPNKNSWKYPYDYPFTWSELGKKVGGGANGVIYRTTITPGLQEMAKSLRFGISPRLPEYGTEVLIKVSEVPSNPKNQNYALEYQEWLEDNLGELGIHNYLLQCGCTRLGSEYETCVSDFIPPLYAGGRVQFGRTPYFMTIMGHVPGAHPHSGPLTQEMYLGIEKAACSMWVNGVLHSDLHTGNILWDARRRRPYIIDFGLGVLVPDQLKREIRKQVRGAINAGVRSLGEIFRPDSDWFVDGLIKHVDGIMMHRRYKKYHSNMSSMLFMYSRTKNTAGMGSARRKLWMRARVNSTAAPKRRRLS